MREEIKVPRWQVRLASGFLAGLFISVAAGLSIGLLWLVFLTLAISQGNMQHKKDNSEMMNRIEEIEKSSKEVEKAVVPNN